MVLVVGKWNKVEDLVRYGWTLEVNCKFSTLERPKKGIFRPQVELGMT